MLKLFSDFYEFICACQVQGFGELVAGPFSLFCYRIVY